MKKCPFCAEEIQDAAIKCRYCNSFLSAAPDAIAAAAFAAPPSAPMPLAAPLPVAAPVDPVAPPIAPPVGNGPAPLTPAAGKLEPLASDRKTLYEGSPSWKAYLGHYILIVLAAIIVPTIMNAVSHNAEFGTRLLLIVIPIVVAVLFFFGTTFYRKSIKFRVTTTAIETENGLLSKQIDVLQLWRCKDVRYRQNLVDRILSIAHIEVFAQDSTTPHLEIVGMPASRQLFENLRDAIEIQRQAKNVYGVVS